MSDLENRLRAVNQVLGLIAPSTVVSKGDRGWVVEWAIGGKKYIRRWQVVNGIHYPSFHKLWPHGGTCCAALVQLMRWLQDRPVYGINVWTGGTIRLGRKNGHEIVNILRSAGYPEESICIACGNPVSNGLYWADFGKISGPLHLFGRCPW